MDKQLLADPLNASGFDESCVDDDCGRVRNVQL